MNTLFRELCFNDRLAYLILFGVIFSVVLIEVHEIFEHEVIYNGYDNFVKPTIEPNCSWDSLPYPRGGINWYFVCVSYMVFNDSQVIPFILSIGLLPVSFLFVRKWSNNFIAILTTIGLALNPVFVIFDTSSAYAQSWAILFLGSLYMMKKNPLVSTGLYSISMFCKAIPMIWGPFIIYGILRSNTKRINKYIITFGIGVPISILFYLSVFDGGSQAYGVFKLRGVGIDSLDNLVFWTKMAYRWNEEILVATPILIALYWIKRKSWKLSTFPLSMLIVSNCTFFMIILFTVEGYFPYRTIPNIVMFLFASSSALHGYLSKNVFKSLEPPKN